MTKRLVLCALFVVCPLRLVAAAGPSDAVVMILTDTKTGGHGYGSGFFMSPDGRVLTCYHVVVNASTARVFAATGSFTDVTVEAISPDRDLAVLKVNGLTGPVPFIAISSQPTIRLGPTESFDVFGHPAVLTDARSHFVARPTSDAFVRSANFRAPDTLQRLFAASDVDLLPLDMTIYNGISGSPVLRGTQAIGVLSGSIQQGGSIAWAIPLKYLAQTMKVDTPIVRMRDWPPLTLMAPKWTSLRREAHVGLPLILAVIRYGKDVEGVRDVLQRLYSEVLKELPLSLAATQQVVDREVAKHGQQFPAARVEGLGEELAAAVEPVVQAFKRHDAELTAAYAQLTASGGTLKGDLALYLDSIPQTPSNQALRDRTADLILRQRQRAAEVLNTISSVHQETFKKIEAEVNVPTLGEGQRAYRRVIPLALQSMQETSRGLQETFTVMGGVQEIVEAMFSADEAPQH